MSKTVPTTHQNPMSALIDEHGNAYPDVQTPLSGNELTVPIDDKPLFILENYPQANLEPSPTTELLAQAPVAVYTDVVVSAATSATSTSALTATTITTGVSKWATAKLALGALGLGGVAWATTSSNNNKSDSAVTETAKGESVKAEPLPEGKLPEIETAKGTSVKAEPLPEGKLPDIETAKGESVKAEPLPEGKLPDIETAKGESVKAEPLPEGKLPDIETAKGESVKAEPLPEGKLPDIETAKGESVKAEPLPEGKLPDIETAKGESVKAEPLPEGKLPDIETAKGESVKAEPLPEGKLPEIETDKGESVKAEPLPEGKLPDIETAKGESVKAEPLPEGKLPEIETAKGTSVKAEPLPEGKLPDIETAKGESVKAEPLPEGKLPEIETAKGTSVKAEPLPEGKLPDIETAKGESVKAEPLPEGKLPPVIHFHSVTDDNVLNLAESQRDITLTGSVQYLAENDRLFLQIGLAEYEANIHNGQFTVVVDGKTLAVHQAITARVVRDEALAVSSEHRYTTDLHIEQPQIQLQPVAVDNVLNTNEATQTIAVSGTVTHAPDNSVVTLTVGHETLMGRVQNGAFTFHIAGSLLQQYAQLQVSVQTVDGAGNTTIATIQHDYLVQLAQPEINLNAVAEDDVINYRESTGNIRIGGRVNNVANGERITVSCGCASCSGMQWIDREATVQNGEFTVDFAGETLVANGYNTIRATVGGVSVQRHYDQDLDAPEVLVRLNDIGNNNVVQSDVGKVVVSGQVTGLAQGETATVKLILGEQEINVPLSDNHQFNVPLNVHDLRDYQEIVAVVDSRDNAGNTNQQRTALNYRYEEVDTTPVSPINPNGESHSADAQIRLVEINHADATQTVRMTGKFELDGIFAKFKNPQQLEGITLKIGDKQYTAGIDKTNQTFYTDIPIADIESLKGQAIEYEIAHLPIYEEPRYQDRERGYKLWAFEHTKPTAKHVILDDHPLLTQRDGDQYRIQNDVPFEPQATLRGTVSGTAKVGDLVQVQIGEHRYETHVQDDNTFELQVAETALLAHQGQPIVATLHATDVSGSLKTVQHQTEYSTAPITDGAWVAKFNTAVAEPAYFIRGIDSGFALGFLSHHQVGQDHTTLKYYLFDAERENVTNGNIVSFTEQNHAILKTQVLDLISKYTNITFEQHYGLAGTDITFYMQNIVYTPGRSRYGSEVGFSKYTFQEGGRTLDSPKGFHIAAHEFMHTLGAKHPHEDVITLKPNQEDLYGLTIMSYQLGSGYEFSTPYRDLRIFDLAYLHYRYNVNPNTRAGNDVYTFKNFNPHAVDGDIYIWDGSGVDTFDASAEKQGVTVDLTPGSWIYSGEKASNLVMTSHSLYSNHDYFDKGHWVQFLPNEQVEGYQATFAKGQAFIGYGTQIENLIGSDHADTLTGNVADNAIYGRAGDDTIRGGAGNDYLDGGSGSDHLHGGLGNDIFVVQQADDQVHELANEGTDTVHAYINYTLGEHVEHLSLFGLATTATGNSENNILRGNALDNTLNGMDGNDRLDAGVGNNTLTGGNGQDTFVFSSLLDGGVDTVTDFNTAEDKIALARSVFTNVNADNVLQQIAYNSETGALSYQSVQFATLSTGLDLQNTHFELV